MRFGITWKILSAVFITTVLVVCSMLFMIQWSFDRGFLNYVNTIEQELHDKLRENLAERYIQEGSWEFIAGNPRAWHEMMYRSFLDSKVGQRHVAQLEQPPHQEKEPKERYFSHKHKFKFGRRRGDIIRSRMALFDTDKQLLIGKVRSLDKIDYLDIKANGQVVGFLGVNPAKNPSDIHDVRFAEHLTRTFLLIATIMLLVSLLLAWPLSRRLVSPIKKLTAATKELASGRYETRISVDSKDELGELSRDFNSLANTLQKNEAARQQWIADISHELRTPLSILRGEIEALQDGVRKYSPDRLSTLHNEVMNLNRLVNDLYELSMSDIGALNYQKEDVEIETLMLESLAGFTDAFSDKNIDVQSNSELSSQIRVNADADRLVQLFSNIFTNTLRYTDSGGVLKTNIKLLDNKVRIIIEDSAPGVDDSDLERIFDRLYRVENSRNKDTGGTGLGLAICHNIIEAHEGEITASQSDLGGVKITICLPVMDT